MTRADELMKKVQVREDGCWIWTGQRNNRGYGIVKREKYVGFGLTCVPAHKEMYEASVGPVAPGLLLDHLCRSRSCVNPDHLEPVTPRQNLLRSTRARAAQNVAKTHCPQGHPYAGENLVNYGGMRLCRACHTARCRAWNLRARERKLALRAQAQRDAETAPVST